MSLNPVQFGKTVIDQFGRYLLTTFPIADADMAAQVKDALRHRTDGLPLLYRGPYVYLNQPFEQGPGIEALIADQALGLHPALKGVFPYDSLHKHQELALRSIKAGRNTILATGTGSGKTEGFLLPILDHCLHLRDRAPSPVTTGEGGRAAPGGGSGVIAVLVYPMNALVNDQLDRLRRLLAGTRVTFARYTGETPDKAGDDLNQLTSPRAYTAQELQGDDDIVCIGTSATVVDSSRPAKRAAQPSAETRRERSGDAAQSKDVTTIDAASATRQFAHRLFGVPAESIEFVTEHYQSIGLPADTYLPLPPPDMPRLLADILHAAERVHLRDEIGELPADLLETTEILCGPDHAQRTTQYVSTNQRLADLLHRNRLIYLLGDIFTRPITWDEALPRFRALPDRATLDDEALIAEMLAYEGLKDDVSLALALDELAVYLGRDNLAE